MNLAQECSAMSELIDKDRPTSNWMQTHSGKKFYPFDPKPDQICIQDISHALGMNCRFNGHVKKFYSVAEHSVLASYMVPEEDALWALLHDAAEAYISDPPKPFKDGISEHIDPHERRILEVIAEKYGLEMPYPESVKKADWKMIIAERVEVLSDQSLLWDTVDSFEGTVPEISFNFWFPERAALMFLKRFSELF